MNKFKNIAIVSAIVAVAAIAALIYVVLLKNPATNPENNQNNNQTEVEQPEDQNKTYVDTVNGFSFTYPNMLKAGDEEFAYIPDGTSTKVPVENSLNHEINVEYCAASGECRPTTQDFGFTVSIINSPLSDVQKAIGGSGQEFSKMQFGDLSAIVLSQGVEGEGINYYFLSMPNNKTLMFSQRYIDENTLVSYKTEPDFISFGEQNTLMSEIISSLKFTK